MKIAFHVSRKQRAQEQFKHLSKIYENHPVEESEVIVVLGGDGTMLRALHKYIDMDIPLYGMNLGTLGFLMNHFETDGLKDRIENALRFDIHPLRMIAEDIHGDTYSEIAFNEVSILRETHNAAKVRLSVNGKVRIEEIVCDGLLVSTPMGSTAYNSSAKGPIVPLDANVLPVTPISVFRPRRWPGALVRNNCEIQFDINDADERKVSATADAIEVRDVVSVKIHESRSISQTLLCDPDMPLEERILQEQFAD